MGCRQEGDPGVNMAGAEAADWPPGGFFCELLQATVEPPQLGSDSIPFLFGFKEPFKNLISKNKTLHVGLDLHLH